MIDECRTTIYFLLMLDTSNTEVARLRAQLAAQAEKHAAEIRGYREQADRDLANLVTVQLENDRLTALVAELRHERDEAEAQKDAALTRAATAQVALDNAFARAARLADEIAPDDDDAWFADLRANGPTPANEKFVSAMAAMEPDEDEIAEAIEQAEREEQERFYQDSNETCGVSYGAGAY